MNEILRFKSEASANEEGVGFALIAGVPEGSTDAGEGQSNCLPLILSGQQSCGTGDGQGFRSIQAREGTGGESELEVVAARVGVDVQDLPAEV